MIIKLAGNQDDHKSSNSSNSGHIYPLASELPALEHWKNIVDMIAPSVLSGSSSNLRTIAFLARADYSLQSYMP